MQANNTQDAVTLTIVPKTKYTLFNMRLENVNSFTHLLHLTAHAIRFLYLHLFNTVLYSTQ